MQIQILGKDKTLYFYTSKFMKCNVYAEVEEPNTAKIKPTTCHISKKKKEKSEVILEWNLEI